MTSAIISILIGLVALAIGGELLVRGAVGIAQKLGVSTLFTGLVIVGFATSMPELVASVQAALLGSPEIAWGNVAGSNISNSLLILGATALIAPIVLSGMGKRDAAVGLAASLILLGLAALKLGSALIGAVLLALLLAYIFWRYTHPRPEGAEDEDDLDDAPSVLWLSVVFLAAGVGALVYGGSTLVGGAIIIATAAGLSETVIGLTIVAIGTSLPELAASAVAAFRGKPGLAIGNVVGSNIYNIFLIGGVTMIMVPKPIPFSLVDYELPLVALSAALIWLLLARAKQIGRMLGGLLLVGFLANTVYLLVAQ